MAINVKKLEDYIGAGFNVLITGPAGTGKTQMLKAAAGNLNLKMKYYNAASMDPWADLVGIPVPTPDGKNVNYARPRDIDAAEVVFIDELNRAEPKTLNAIFELVQFQSINGEKMENLKCVVAAINPVEDGYNTEELDVALTDRFNVYLSADPVADYNYFKGKFGVELAREATTLFKEYQDSYNSSKRSKQNTIGYLSPRRLEIILDNYVKFPSAETISVSVPSDVSLGAKRWHERFKTAMAVKVNGAAAAVPAAASVSTTGVTEAHVTEQLRLSAPSMRTAANNIKFKKAYAYALEQDARDGSQRAENLLNVLAVSLSYGVGVKGFQTKWFDVVKDFNPAQRQKMMSGWEWNKEFEIKKLFGWS